jgi:hypothetical protein
MMIFAELNENCTHYYEADWGIARWTNMIASPRRECLTLGRTLDRKNPSSEFLFLVAFSHLRDAFVKPSNLRE